MRSETASIRSGFTPLLGSVKSPDTPSITWTKWGRDRKKAKRYGADGWRVGVTICASTAAAVLLINIGLTIWASTLNGLSNGIATVQNGSCQKTRNLSLWLHLAINVLSTVLLGASNYCMQCLSSPTREEIDRAHARRIWLDIGVPSLRNLRGIAQNRVVLWWLLALSSIPLHLLYNSAVSSTLSSQEYFVYVGSGELVSGNYNNWTAITPTGTTEQDFVVIPTFAEIYQNISNWQNMTSDKCIKAYGQAFVSNRSTLLAISSSLNASDPLIYMSHASMEAYLRGGFPEYSWMCSAYASLRNGEGTTCDINGLSRYSSDWNLERQDFSQFAIQYCLSQPIEEHCRLQMSLVVMCIVMLCNFMKALCMYLILRHQKFPPLVTLGDAIESFLHKRDPTTESMCLANKNDLSSRTGRIHGEHT